MKGHSLWHEGAAYDAKGRRVTTQGTGGTGHAKCRCGAISPLLESGNQRKAWHRRHKELIRNTQPTSGSD